MDLSIEAEAFGSPVRYSASEVPTVISAIVKNSEDAQKLKRIKYLPVVEPFCVRHLSRLLLLELSVGFFDYLNKVRIEKSK